MFTLAYVYLAKCKKEYRLFEDVSYYNLEQITILNPQLNILILSAWHLWSPFGRVSDCIQQLQIPQIGNFSNWITRKTEIFGRPYPCVFSITHTKGEAKAF